MFILTTDLKVRSFVILSLLFVSLSAEAQRSNKHRFFDGGVLLGVTNYSGDVAEKRVEWNETNPGYGFFLRYHFNNNFALKVHAYSGSISGDDKNTSKSVRSFRFGTDIFETALLGEWTIGGKDRYSNTGIHQFQIRPYLFAGFGMTFAESQAEYYGPPEKRNDYLKVPLPEEGLKKRFPLIPIGFGVQTFISERLMIGGELGLRPTFSDDIDGMKINGNPDAQDWYFFTGVTISFILADPEQN